MRSPRRTGATRLPLWLHVLLVLATAAALLIGLWALFLSEPTTPLAAAPTDALLIEVIRLIFFAIAGIGGVVALTVAYRKQRLGEAAEERENAKLFTEQFAAAADQLSSEQAANRLAGVYAMADLADDWERGRQKCINVLCAYLRMPYDPPQLPEAPTPEDKREFKAARQERQVRHAILDSIGEHLRRPILEDQTWHTCDFDLTGATLDGGNLSYAVFAGEVSFRQTRFPEGMLFARGAKFLNGVGFANAEVDGGQVSLIEAEFSGLTQFAWMRVTGGELSFAGAVFNGFATFAHAQFARGEVNFGIDGHIQGAQFNSEVEFEQAEFSGAGVSFDGFNIAAGEVDFSMVANWSFPPNFGRFRDLRGLQLPSDEHLKKLRNLNDLVRGKDAPASRVAQGLGGRGTPTPPSR